MTAKFRALCGIPDKKTPWPTDPLIERTNPATGEVYFNPWFNYPVTYEDNEQLFEAVSRAVMRDFHVSASLQLLNWNHAHRQLSGG